MAFKKKKVSGRPLDPDAEFGAQSAVPVEKVAKQQALPEAAARPTVNLDKRKLTRKQKEEIEAKWVGPGHGNALDTYIGGLATDIRQKFPLNRVMLANETTDLIIGIPCPSLSFEYLIAQDVFPLGLIFHLVGPPGTCKSALLFEIMRWFIEANGMANLYEVESKLSPDWLPSIIGHDRARRVVIDFCNSVEDWQKHLMFWLKFHKKKLVGTKEAPGPGRTVPILLGVDSIMGKPAEGTQEKVHGQGHGSKMFPEEALIITQWIKTVPQEISTWPFAIVLNNHLKMGKDDSGNDLRRTGGGEGTKFQESFELETSVRRSKIGCADWDGRVIGIKCWKNSFGPTFRNIDVRILWWEEENPEVPGTYRQRTVFDWHWGTINMLNKLEGRELAELKKVFHLKVEAASDVQNSAWSATLGMKAKDAVSWSELGLMIAQDANVLSAIRSALGIKRRPLLDGDYLVQMDRLSKELI